MFIAPLELQIPFKLLLGTQKDIEDAVYLYQIFKSKIDIPLMERFEKLLKIDPQKKRLLS